MPWSAEQLKAIHTVGKNILVAAAAGSGKTSVLVERVIENIISGRCDINEMLVVTFTNAAASEMRERIAAAITEKLPDKDKERQLVLLNAASISTLHSFCQNIIRQNFHELGLDPKFRLASEQECALLKQDVLDELFEQKYDNENNADFLHFTDMYGSERGDDAIYAMLLKLYEYSRSQPFPDLWLKSLPHHFDIDSSIYDTPWLKLLWHNVDDELNYCRSIIAEMHHQADELKLEPLLKTADADLSLIDTYLNCSNWDELQKTIGTISFARMSPSKKIPADIKDSFKQQRDKVKSILKKLQENYFSQSMEQVLSDMPALHRDAAMLCSLTLDFAAAFAKAKAEKALLDFSDLEHFALQLLAAPGSTAENLLPSPAACQLQEKYKEIMVDEYQDTNGVQEAIIQLIASRQNPNCFFVGDVKQSIYKFRLAEPELFLQKYNSYPQKADCERIDLAQNFRSRREILTAINFIFRQIMTLNAAELPYGQAEALRCGFDYPKAENLHTLCSPIELTIIDKKNANNAEDSDENPTGFNAEAAYIVQRIKDLMAKRPLVYDKNDKAYRPLKWRDIVVLMRTIKEKGQILSDALRSADIPVYSSDESGYFQASEVRVMLSLLQIIDNPRQDIPLAAVLFSPIVGLSEAQLTQIRMTAMQPEQDLYDALLSAKDSLSLSKELTEKVYAFLSNLEKWRIYARCHSVPELVWRLLDETGYYDYVGGMKEGLVRQANLRALYDRAKTYEQTTFRGLFRFLHFIQRMKDMGSDLEIARSLSESEDVVRIMSIHKSKGLEFPVVILADIGKRFNLKDAQQETVLIHKQLGLGLYVADAENHIRYQTLPRQAIAEQITHEIKAEEMRTLYVAMTRAREKLIMIGSTADADKFAAHCCTQMPQEGLALPDYCITSANTYLDWLGAALVRHADGHLLRLYGGAESASILNDDSRWQINIISSVENTAPDIVKPDVLQLLQIVKEHQALPPSPAKKFIESRLNWQYPYESSAAVPAKLSVTEIKRRFSEEEAALDFDEHSLNIASNNKDKTIFKRPLFLQQSADTMTSAEYGTLMHTVMQHLDLKGDLTDSGISGQLSEMAKDEIIAYSDVGKIYRKNIRQFLHSPLGLRLQKSSRVERELAFSRILSAHEINELMPGKTIYPESDGNENIFIQGVIDVLFYENDGLVLIDYKTDRCSADEAREKYDVQIKLYAAAAQAILHKKVKEKYLYLFHSGSIVSMEKP